MSSLPIELDFTADPSATPSRMDKAMLFLLAYLRRLESVQPEFVSVTADLKATGLARLDAVLSPIFTDAQAISAQLTAIKTAWLTGTPVTQIVADLAAQVTARLAASDQRLVDNQAAVTAALAALVVGQTVQAYSSKLDALAAVAADAFGRSLLTLTDAAGLRGKAGLGSIATLAEATVAEFRSATAARALSAAIVWAAAQPVPLVDAATIAIDLSTFINGTVTLAGNRTLGAPTNGKIGQSGTIEVRQDATGSRTLAFSTGWSVGSTVPVLSTTAGTRDVLRYEVLSDGKVDLYLSKAR